MMANLEHDLRKSLESFCPIHIIGGGGVGMSALGLLLLHRGYRVSASDQKESEYLDKLNQSGAKTWVGSSPKSIDNNAIVFHSTAIGNEDVERKYCETQGRLISSRHFLLNYLTEKFFTIAISGTHGKTTTSAWVAYALEIAGLDPNAVIGGSVHQWQSNIRLGRGSVSDKSILVIEADESDRSFLNIAASIAATTNIDIDHTDQYESIEEVQEQFERFSEQCIKNKGFVIFSTELDSNKLCKVEEGSLYFEEEKVQPSLPGVHNLHNASIVIQICHFLKINRQDIIKAITTFEGVGRRLHQLTSGSVKVFDDYGHHPKEMKTVLEIFAKSEVPLIVFWEPHRISRFLYFFQDFYNVLRQEEVEKFYLLPVFTAKEEAKNFDQYEERLEAIKQKSAGSLSSISDIESLSLQLEKGANIIFFGAAESTNYAKALAEQFNT